MASKLGDLYVNVSSKGISKVNEQLGTAEKKASIASKAFTLLQGAIMAIGSYAVINAIKRMISEFVEYTSAIDKAHKITGIATDTLQKLKYVADQEHASFDTLNRGLRILIRNMQYVKDGMLEGKRAFDNIGVSALNTDGSLRNVEDVFLDISDAVKNAKTETQASAIALDLLGRSGSELVPMMRMGKEEIKALTDEFERMHGVLDPKTIRAGKELGDNIWRAQTEMKALSRTIITDMVPALNNLLSVVRDLVKQYEQVKQLLIIMGDISKWTPEGIGRQLGFSIGTKLNPALQEWIENQRLLTSEGGMMNDVWVEASRILDEYNKETGETLEITSEMRQQYRDMIALEQALVERRAILTDATGRLTDAEIEYINAQIIVNQEAQEAARIAREEAMWALWNQAYLIQSFLSPALHSMYGALLEGGNAWQNFADAAVDAIKRIIVQMMAMATIAAILSTIFPGLGNFATIFGSLIGLGKGYQSPQGDWWAQKEGRDFGKFFMDGFQTSFVPMLQGVNVARQQPMNVVVHTGDPSTYVEFMRKLPSQYKSKLYREVTIPGRILEG